ncbi:MAG: hypothetical protein A2494_03830 [Candidatus Lloydbacteria bacterium RIFOXYC12_FULL_46_25]|uniref:Uncharacterized protein n=1 Tax=Candidatus Lloydbacteria bacterium RIFOXYC12_FULL_46_25 TaxID=1798670 RepID=A0A1G2DRX2_9BACT|nr:MAG: hypothetical protein A2494_03830 [Candidatus Lloydbacteria bacterium RIFOXYC12_FULL_46_25]
MEEKNGNMNRVIYWIPSLEFAAHNLPGLKKALTEQGIIGKMLFHPTSGTPQSFVSGYDNLLNVDAALGFSFRTVTLREVERSRGLHIRNVSENSLKVPVSIVDMEKYPPDELARYLKECWIPHPADPVN